MVNTEIADALKCLHNELVNEIDNQNAGRLDDEQIQILADCIKTLSKLLITNSVNQTTKCFSDFPRFFPGVFS